MKPLEGVRVLEVAMYGFVPSAGAVLAEWGAEVIKVEHAVTGDPQRGLRQTGMLRVEGDPNPNIEHANRGKRSIGLDVSTPEGREVLLELARRDISRERAYEWVQRNAMRSFHERTDFKSLLLADADITQVLGAAEIERAFDLDEQLRNVDAIFTRVFDGPSA